MPGNEVGDRIHNFFGEDNLSQGQQHSQGIDTTWPGLSNNPWGGGPRQIGGNFISILKNNNVQLSADTVRGHGDQVASLQHGNFSHPNLQPEFVRNQSQSQQPNLNGYMHGHQVFQMKQNEANSFGAQDRHNVTAQIPNGHELKKTSVRMDFPESPVNYDFFGGQQQISGQNPGMLQSLSRQQSGVSDIQMQQLMLKQMQELQRQQQLHKQQLQNQEARPLNAMNQVNAFAKQSAFGHSTALVNGFPVQDASHASWQHEAMAPNTNWPQRGPSTGMQGPFNGQIISHEQGQAPHFTGMVPQQVDHSLYGVPISGTRVSKNQISPMQMHKPMAQQTSGNNSFLGNQLTSFPDQGGVQDGNLVSRQGYQGKNMVGSADGQGLNIGFNLENLQQVNPQHNNGSMVEFHGRQDLSGPSEIVQEKHVMQATPAQNVATLDPTEEKILFGSDDNLWDAFGKGANMGSGGYNIMDGTDILGAFPSTQSGSWSALMQSAVAETSSSDVGPQEEWSGLTFQNSEPPAGNQQGLNDSSRQRSGWMENSLQTSAQTSGPFPPSDDTNRSMNCYMKGVQQVGASTLHHQVERLQTGSPQRSTQHFPGDSGKWLDGRLLQKEVSEGTQVYGKVSHSSNAESIAKGAPGSWTNQQGVSSYSTGGRPSSRPNGWTFIDSVPPSTSAALETQRNDDSLQYSQGADPKTNLLEEPSHGAGIWKTDSVTNSGAELGHGKSVTGSPRFNRDDSNQNNIVPLDSNSLRANQACGQQFPNSNNIDVWKHVDSSIKPKGSKNPGKNHPRLDDRHQDFESSGNNSLENGAHEVQNSSMMSLKANRLDSFQNASHSVSTSGARENAWLESSDLCNFPGGKPNPFGLKPSGVRKFQYHPMGDVTVDPSYGAKHITVSHPMLPQVSQGLMHHDQGLPGVSKFPNHIARNSLESEKDRVDMIRSKSMLLGSSPSSSVPSDKLSSQNMLELLHKVDQSRERGSTMQLSTSMHNQSSEMSEAETSDGSVHPQQNQSAGSQGFGLQLAPPSQRSPAPGNAFACQSPSQTFNSHSSTHVAVDKGDKGDAWLVSAPSAHSASPLQDTSQGQSRNIVSGASGLSRNKNTQGNFPAAFASSFPYSRSHLQNDHVIDAGGQVATSQPGNVSFNRFNSQSKQMNESFDRAKTSQLAVASPPARDASQNDLSSTTDMSQPTIYNLNARRDPIQQSPLLEAAPEPQFCGISGLSQEDYGPKTSSAMVWNSVSTLQRPFSDHPFKTPSTIFKPNFQSNSNSETAFSQQQKLDDKNAKIGGKDPAEAGACSMNSHGFVGKEQQDKADLMQVSSGNDFSQKPMGDSQRKENVLHHDAGTSFLNPASTQKQIEAFGRSLRPNNTLHQTYSLLHPVQGMKNIKVDPSNLVSERFRVPDGAVDPQLVGTQGVHQFGGHSSVVRDASASVPSEDATMLNFSAKPAADQDTNTFGLNSSQSSNRGEHSQISPQMAPSWFDQYGTFKNGQILAMYDSRKSAIVKTSELPFTIGRSSDISLAHGPVEQGNDIASDVNQCDVSHKNSTFVSLASENLPTPQLLHPDAAVMPKKRRSATSELVPWHKELTQGYCRVQNISSAEIDWAQSTNRLAEKVEDEAEMVDDWPPAHRSKRRLVLTTQLMQLLLRPPLTPILSANAFSHCESVTYSVARSTLGDSCSSLSCSGSDTPVSFNSGNLLMEKLQSSRQVCDLTEIMEDLINKAKKVEKDLLRLDKSVSILDLRVECQDLEKFSVINRFAKFHGRGAETLSSSSDSPANAQKPYPQRYVTALAMPRNLPDGVQCLSL